jgi:hypothetical protein
MLFGDAKEATEQVFRSLEKTLQMILTNKSLNNQ